MGKKFDVYFSTWEGEIVKLKLQEKQKERLKQSSIIECKKANKFNNILSLKGDLRCVSLLERDDDLMTFVAGDASQIYGFSHEDHQLID